MSYGTISQAHWFEAANEVGISRHAFKRTNQRGIQLKGIHLVIEFGESVDDGYKQLPTLFNDVSDKNIELLSDEDELANGGAAMAAYAKIQFEDMSEYEREELERGLLKYCELDTLAMVMVYEAWTAMLNEAQS